MDLTLDTLACVIILFGAALTRSTFGFGEALVAMPLLSLLIDVRMAAAVVGLTSVVNALAILAQSWRSVQWQPAWRLIVSTFLGIPIGVYALITVPVLIVKVLLAVLVIGFAVYNLWHPRLWQLKSESSAYGFGLIAGVLGGAYNTLGPPLVIFGSLRRWPPDEFRSTLQAIFLPASLFVIANHYVQGLWEREVFLLFFVSIPVILAATILGRAFHRKLDSERFEKLIFVMLILVGITLLVSAIYQR